MMLGDTQNLQRAILDNAGYAIIATTTEGTIISFNPAAERMLGYRADELVGKETPACFHDLDEVVRARREFSDELGETIEPGFEVFVAKARRDLPNEHEWTYVHKDGRSLPGDTIGHGPARSRRRNHRLFGDGQGHHRDAAGPAGAGPGLEPSAGDPRQRGLRDHRDHHRGDDHLVQSGRRADAGLPGRRAGG